MISGYCTGSRSDQCHFYYKSKDCDRALDHALRSGAAARLSRGGWRDTNRTEPEKGAEHFPIRVHGPGVQRDRRANAAKMKEDFWAPDI